MTAPEDVNVDDLKRRARRRLVGAIVLALAAAVFVPMLLESDPKPLGEDVAVKIPPVDDGKFVNRLNDKAKTEPAKPGAAKGETRADSAKSEAMKAETARAEAAITDTARPESARTDTAKGDAAKGEMAKLEAPASDTPKTEGAKVETPRPETPSSDAGAAAAPPKRSLAEAEQRVLAAPAKPTSSAAPASTAPAAAEPAPKAPPAPAPAAEPPASGFSVQLAAFSDDKGANSLSNKLKKAGYPAYTEPLTTSKGTLWRVRVGPYPSREAAVSSRNKLKGEGYDGIVAAVK